MNQSSKENQGKMLRLSMDVSFIHCILLIVIILLTIVSTYIVTNFIIKPGQIAHSMPIGVLRHAKPLRRAQFFGRAHFALL